MAIIFKDVSKTFGTNTVYENMNLTIREGETTVLVGSSGSGKSTLLRCINLLEIPEKGTLTVQGDTIDFSEHISGRQKAPFRLHTGMVFQSFNLFPHLTVLENVMEGPVHVQGVPKETAKENALTMLKKVNMSEKADAFPNRLSGGQQQRVAIARSLAMKPLFLLMDEPTSALDPELEMEVLKVISEIAAEGQSLVIVTHNMSFARNVADRILFLEKGKIAYDGATESFFTSEEPRIVKFLSSITIK